MKCFGLLLVLFTLSSCGTQSATHDMAESATTSATALEQSLTKECATEAIKTQINVIKSQIKAITSACNTEKQVIEQEKIRWKWAFLGLAIAIAAYIAKKLTNRI